MPSNLEILTYEDTPLGPLCLRRRELLSAPGTVVTEVTLDHAFLVSSYNTASGRALASVAPEMHEGRVIDWLHRDLVPLSSDLKDDPRLAISRGAAWMTDHEPGPGAGGVSGTPDEEQVRRFLVDEMVEEGDRLEAHFRKYLTER